MYLYPEPQSIEWLEGCYRPPREAQLRVSPGAMDEARQALIAALWQQCSATAGRLAIVEDAALPPYTARMGEADCALEAEDHYALVVEPTGLMVRGRDATALAHGLYTLLQPLRPTCLDEGAEALAIDAMRVHDRPQLAMRSLHLSIFPGTTLLDVERALRLAGFLKMSHVVLEFWGMLQLDSLPELAWMDRAYTKADFRPMIELAGALGLELIPMFNHLGHASQSRETMGRHAVLDQNPRHALLFEPDGWTWCLSNPEVGRILASLREELIDFCGPGQYFHLGCDEAYSFASCTLCREHDRTAMFRDFLNELAADLAGRGRRGIIWGDALLDASAWPAPYIATSQPDQLTHLALEGLDRRLVIADWQYSQTLPELETARHFKQQGFDVLACAWDHPRNIASLAAAAASEGLLGVMNTTWHHLQGMLGMMPGLASHAWRGGDYVEAAGQNPRSGNLLRRLMPFADGFERGGYRPYEVGAWD